MKKPRAIDLYEAMGRLKSLIDGDRAISGVVACGAAAISPLKALLFVRESSGLFQVRCRAVEALARLKAYDVLINWLAERRFADDPVERLGDDAVINAAARALGKAHCVRAYPPLLSLAERPCLTGVIEALGNFQRADAVPALIAALADDQSRPVAENILWHFGSPAVPALVECAVGKEAINRQSETRLRQRRSALSVLQRIGVPPDEWDQLRDFMNDPDPAVAARVCEIGLMSAPEEERRLAVKRLEDLASQADVLLHDEIVGCLAAANSALDVVAGARRRD